MRDDVRWTHLSLREIVDLFAERGHLHISTHVIRQLLRKHHYRRRKAQKRKTMKKVAHRNEQFENITSLKQAHHAAFNPVISMDTKKKELIGNLYRPGQLYTQDEIQTFDHDFPSLADGVVIPHGLYDIYLNRGYLHLGTSHDTSEFSCECFRRWWLTYGRIDYPKATCILVLCDGGGSNHCRHIIFKEDLQHLSNELGIEIRIAHYPPYCSKYNPIEHRLFPHVTRACQGVIFKSVALVKALMANTHTRTGLSVVVDIIDKVYQTKRKASETFRNNVTLICDDLLPQWNYRAVPQTE